MKYILLTLISFMFEILSAQIPNVEIEGRLSIGLPGDSTSVHIGKHAGESQISTNRNNTFVGSFTGSKNTVGHENSFIGTKAGNKTIGGDSNSFFGYKAGYENTHGWGNSFFGSASGRDKTRGNSNSLFGSLSGRHIHNGDANICIGFSSGPIVADSSKSNRLYIDVQTTSDPLIYGEFDNDIIRVNGELETEDGSIFMRNLGSTDTNKGIKWGEGADTPIFGLVYDGVGNGSESRLHVREYNSTDNDIMTFKADGKIGIGTDNPQFKTVIKSTGNAMAPGGATVDISNLATVFSKEENIINEAIGIGFQSSSNLTTVGGAIIFERAGPASKGNLHFATKFSTGSDEDIPIRMTITNDGKVGIANLSPTATLDVGGEINGTGVFCNYISACSDERLKKDFTPINNPIPLIQKISGFYHYWNIRDFPERGFTDKKQIGFIAQDIQKVIPEIVNMTPDGFLSVEYGKVVPILVEAIKQQQVVIENQNQELENIKKQLTTRDEQFISLLSRIEHLENEMNLKEH